jgi:hypothetical protein
MPIAAGGGGGASLEPGTAAVRSPATRVPQSGQDQEIGFEWVAVALPLSAVDDTQRASVPGSGAYSGGRETNPSQ